MKKAVWAICDRLVEVQAILQEHLETGKYRKDEVAWLIAEILSEEGLSEAMHSIGYLEPSAVRH
jgi:hypothetical protein